MPPQGAAEGQGGVGGILRSLGHDIADSPLRRGRVPTRDSGLCLGLKFSVGIISFIFRSASQME